MYARHSRLGGARSFLMVNFFERYELEAHYIEHYLHTICMYVKGLVYFEKRPGGIGVSTACVCRTQTTIFAAFLLFFSDIYKGVSMPC